jgi:peptidoglycan pentaglycine glycine transferase (the first glycine)
MKFFWSEIEPDAYQQFVDNFAGEQTFVQSQKYGKFRAAIGEKIYYIGISNSQKLVGVALIQKITSKIKTFLHCPHGPLVEQTVEKEIFYNFFLKQYRTFGRSQNCHFVRINPLLEDKPEHAKIFRSGEFRSSSIHMVNPEHTWILDINRPAEDILAAMKKRRRAEARGAEKFGATTRIGNNKEDLDIFWDLHLQTVARQGFVPFPRSNTEKELKIFGKDAQIFSTKIDNKYYSSSLILFDKKSAYYHQGSSTYHKAPVARMNLWAAILEAKKRGCTQFNFWGVVDDNDTKHPWYGLSKFKKGFGGSKKKYLHCQDGIIDQKRYWLNYGVEKYRRWKRGY